MSYFSNYSLVIMGSLSMLMHPSVQHTIAALIFLSCKEM